jgi:DNA-nicking Smr family endonuclease
MARRRTLKPEEVAIWQAVAQTATPMHMPAVKHSVGPIQNMPPKFRVQPQITPKPRFIVPTSFRLGEKSGLMPTIKLKPRLQESLCQAPLQMDKKNFGRMTKGKIAPEAQLDLHGMTVAEAHPSLQRFIVQAHNNGLRLVLVVTGKGKQGPDIGPIPQNHGILRHQVPQWLRMAPIAAVVLQTAQAHARHGGAGAYYVYLRRR